MMWIAMGDFGVFSVIRSRTQPIGDTEKNRFECGMLNLECALPFTIHIHDRNGKFEWIQY
jgi:hypothetical protein